jgi:hypothetical protein
MDSDVSKLLPKSFTDKHLPVGGENHEHETLIQKLQNEMTGITPGIYAGAGFVVGMAARMPGEIGIIGKVASAALGGLTGADMLYRKFEEPNQNNKGAYARDALFLGSMTLGLVAGHHAAKLLPEERTGLFPRPAHEPFAKPLAKPFGGIPEHDTVVRSGDSIYNGRFKAADDSNVINFAEAAKALGKKGPQMIEETEIAKFPEEKQAAIRNEIKEWTDRGYSPRHLALDDNGGIYLDRDLIDSDSQVRAMRGDFDKK